MLTSAAIVPAAPILVPEVAAGAAGELDAARAAIDAALAVMLGHAPEVVVVVGAGDRTMRHDPGSRGSLRPIGVDLAVALGRADGLAEAPPNGPAALGLSLTVGAWVLARAQWTAPVRGLEVARHEAPQVCLGAGAGLADDCSRVALLVLADGTARRGPKAPGYTDHRARGFDSTWLDAVASADPQALAMLDPVLAEELMMAGRAPLQVLAGAAGRRSWSGRLLYADDPYGVQYAVADWQPADWQPVGG